MKTSTRAGVRVGAALAATGFALAAASTAAYAAGTAIPDSNSQGKVILQNSSGQQITSGNLQDDPFSFKEIATSAASNAADNKATLYFATPVDNTPTGSYPSEKYSASVSYNPATQFPTVQAPSAGGGNSLASYICDQPSSSTTYPNEYELRVVPSGTGVAAAPASYYWASTILVNITSSGTGGTPTTCDNDPTQLTGTWTQVDAPAAGAATGPTTVTPALPEAPYAVLLPLLAGGIGVAGYMLRRRKLADVI